MGRAALSSAAERAGWGYFLFHLLILPGVIRWFGGLIPILSGDAEQNVLYYAVNYLAVWGIFRSFLMQSGADALRKPIRFLLYTASGLLGYYVVSWGLELWIGQIRPDFANINNSNLLRMAGSRFWLMAAGIVLLNPVSEECLFRGLLFCALRHRGKAAAWVISMLLFAAVHVVGYLGKYDGVLLLLCFLQYLPAGFFLVWVCNRTESIWASILMHAIINAISVMQFL